jgi:aryl-alcohol dehydrogenase-like predicted oxidoreductase
VIRRAGAPSRSPRTRAYAREQLLASGEQGAMGRRLALPHFASVWVLAHRAVTAVIAGPRTFEQWVDYFGALDVTITPEDEAVVDALVAPGHPSTPGYNDPAYPWAGRRG